MTPRDEMFTNHTKKEWSPRSTPRKVNRGRRESTNNNHRLPLKSKWLMSKTETDTDGQKSQSASVSAKLQTEHSSSEVASPDLGHTVLFAFLLGCFFCGLLWWLALFGKVKSNRGRLGLLLALLGSFIPSLALFGAGVWILLRCGQFFELG